jgi:hypothetical protein
MKEKFGDRIYGRYGFVDAFNPQSGWIDTEVIGINAGIILLSAENGRTGDVWRWFMRNQEIPRAMERIGFVSIRSKVDKISSDRLTASRRLPLTPRDLRGGRSWRPVDLN